MGSVAQGQLNQRRGGRLSSPIDGQEPARSQEQVRGRTFVKGPSLFVTVGIFRRVERSMNGCIAGSIYCISVSA